MQTHSMRPLSEAQIEKESKVKETDLNELAAENRIKNYIFFLSESLLNVPIFPTFEKNKWDLIVSVEGRIWHREGYIARNHK